MVYPKESGERPRRARWPFAAVFTALAVAALANVSPDGHDGPAQPPSPVIAQMEWAPEWSIVRRAPGSDTWPVTWGDNGALYTAYADGRGFRPFVERKLSQGLARVRGGPASPRGHNLRAPTFERRGDGPSGEKTSSLLMIDGTLYAFIRNANGNGRHCRIGWSGDRGKTWQWAAWRFRRFGYCVFLNFGRDYAGARDDYVYVYSPDSPSAYRPADHMILMRVPKDELRHKARYEFFAGQGDDGTPRWTDDVAQRRPVFSNPGNCLRSSVTYNPGIQRYLWWQQLPGSIEGIDTRFEGGFAVYDAPEPWGPWTTAYHTERWDVGPGETGTFPSKWIRDGGRTLHLVFSGDDHFSIRRARLRLHDD